MPNKAPQSLLNNCKVSRAILITLFFVLITPATVEAYNGGKRDCTGLTPSYGVFNLDFDSSSTNYKYEYFWQNFVSQIGDDITLNGGEFTINGLDAGEYVDITLREGNTYNSGDIIATWHYDENSGTNYDELTWGASTPTQFRLLADTNYHLEYSGYGEDILNMFENGTDGGGGECSTQDYVPNSYWKFWNCSEVNSESSYIGATCTANNLYADTGAPFNLSDDCVNCENEDPFIWLNDADGIEYNNIQTFGAEGEWEEINPLRRWLSAVRTDDWYPTVRYGADNFGPYAENGTYNNYATTNPIYMPNGTYSIRFHVIDIDTNHYASDPIIIELDGQNYNELTIGNIPINDYELGNDGFFIEDENAPAGFDFSASASEQIGLFLILDDLGNACDTNNLIEDATSTLCVIKNESARLFNYPLFGWVTGIATAIIEAWGQSEADATSSYSLELDGPTEGYSAKFIPNLTIIDSASDTKGIGYWYSQTGGDEHAIIKYRPIFIWFLWFAFVYALLARAKSLIRT